MRQALHIFKKDVRHLWPAIGLTLTAIVLFTAVVARDTAAQTDQTMRGTAFTLLSFLVPIAWWVLIARVVHNEPLAEADPHWVTRPYDRRSLLASKILFIVLFVSLPKLLSDVVVLQAFGFGFWEEAAGLLWTQVVLIVLLVLPQVALCTLFSRLTHVLVVVLVSGVAFAGWSVLSLEIQLEPFSYGRWIGVEWIQGCCVGLIAVAAAAVIIARQYSRRGTALSRVLAGGAVLAAVAVTLVLPWQAAFAVQRRLSRQSIPSTAVRIGWDRSGDPGRTVVVPGDDLRIPVAIADFPAGMTMRPQGIDVTIDAPDGSVWRGEGRVPTSGFSTSIFVRIPPDFYRKTRTEPVTIRVATYLTLYGNQHRTVLAVREQERFVAAQGAGLCSATRKGERILVLCRSAFQSGRDMVYLDVEVPHPDGIGGPPTMWHRLSNQVRPPSYSPFPAVTDATPVVQSLQATNVAEEFAQARVHVIALEPLAYLRRDFEMTGVRLADYEPIPMPAVVERNSPLVVRGK